MAEGRLIMIAVDGSSVSDHAVEFAIQTIFREGDRALVVHAMEPVGTIYNLYEFEGYISLDDKRKLEDEANRKGLAIAKAAAEPLKKAGIPYESRLVVGDVRDGIVDAAESSGADMIVIGTRGMGAIKRAVLGSVSDYVIHHSHVSVMVVRPPREADAPKTTSGQSAEIVQESKEA